MRTDSTVYSARSAQSGGLVLAFLLALVLLPGCVTQQPGQTADPVAVAEQIRARFEQALPGLPLDKQRHYAQRLYRMTGAARYLPMNRAYGKRLVRRLNKAFTGLETPGYAARRAREIVTDYPTRTKKQRRRKQMLAAWGDIAFAKSLAFELVQAKSYGLLNEHDLPGYQRALDYLAAVDFRDFLLDADVMAIYASQVANL